MKYFLFDFFSTLNNQERDVEFVTDHHQMRSFTVYFWIFLKNSIIVNNFFTSFVYRYVVMFNALDSVSRGLGLRPGRVNALCCWSRHSASLNGTHNLEPRLCIPHLNGESY